MSLFPTDYYGDLIQNTLRAANITAPAALYIGLYDGDPTATGVAASEITTIIRPAGRIQISYSAPVSGVMTATGDIDFGLAVNAASFGGIGILDAATNGNMLFHGGVATEAVAAGNFVTAEQANLTVTLPRTFAQYDATTVSA